MPPSWCARRWDGVAIRFRVPCLMSPGRGKRAGEQVIRERRVKRSRFLLPDDVPEKAYLATNGALYARRLEIVNSLIETPDSKSISPRKPRNEILPTHV